MARAISGRAGLVCLVFLSACGLSAPAGQPGAERQSPTISLFFEQTAVHTLPTPVQAAGHPETPTQAAWFTGNTAPTRTGTPTTALPTPDGGRTIPTLSGFFQPTAVSLTGTAIVPVPPQPGTPTPAQYFQPRPSATIDPAQPSPTPGKTRPAAGSPTATALPSTDPGQLKSSSVFSGELDPAWSLENSWGIQWAPEEAAVFSYLGKKSVRVTPTEDYGSVFFTVKNSGGSSFARHQVVGVSFWVNPGDTPIRPDQLAVSMVGSNENTYWLKGDTTVTAVGKGQTFSETRLYFLNVNRSLPANSWTEILVWLDKLLYDPDYLYVTGMYIKTDKDFRSTFYIAEVRLFELK